jgi:hypothetical protein
MHSKYPLTMIITKKVWYALSTTMASETLLYWISIGKVSPAICAKPVMSKLEMWQIPIFKRQTTE